LQGCFTRDSEELFEAVVQEDIVPYEDGSPLHLTVAPDRRAGNGWLLHKTALAFAPVDVQLLNGRDGGNGGSDAAAGPDGAVVRVTSRDADGVYIVTASSDERLAQATVAPPVKGEVRLAALCGAWVGSEESRSPATPEKLELTLTPDGGGPEDAAWLSLTADRAGKAFGSVRRAHVGTRQATEENGGSRSAAAASSFTASGGATGGVYGQKIDDDAELGGHPPPAPGTRVYRRGYRRLPTAVTLKHSAAAFPHPDKVRSGMRGHCTKTEGVAGEDAYAIHVTRRGALLAVADGVHAWSRVGINSGDTSSALVLEARRRFARALETNASSTLGPYLPKPLRLLNLSWEAVRSRGIKGSTTVMLAALDGRTGVLRSANLGDSGFVVFRDVRTDHPTLLFSSPHQEHFFGMPYQLGHHDRSDVPDDAELHEVRLQPGDIIVCGSDGLFDNLAELDILTMVQQAERPALLANALAKAAFDVSMDSSAASPWSQWAEEELDMPYVGGKPDDITVIVAEVVLAS
jgi:protein phosphatase PTC7